MTDPRSGFKTPDRFAEYDALTSCCPVCDEVIAGLDADDRTTIQPCGHSAAGLTPQTMTSTTNTDEHRLMTDGGKEYAPVLFVAYEDDAKLQYGSGPDPSILNHDNLVNSGQTYDEIRMLPRDNAHQFNLDIIEPGDSLWCDAVAELGPGDAVRVDELGGEGDD